MTASVYYRFRNENVPDDKWHRLDFDRALGPPRPCDLRALVGERLRAAGGASGRGVASKVEQWQRNNVDVALYRADTGEKYDTRPGGELVPFGTRFIVMRVPRLPDDDNVTIVPGVIAVLPYVAKIKS